ncbi:unnamed protein product [Gadus morhua 'NCC']
MGPAHLGPRGQGPPRRLHHNVALGVRPSICQSLMACLSHGGDLHPTAKGRDTAHLRLFRPLPLGEVLSPTTLLLFCGTEESGERAPRVDGVGARRIVIWRGEILRTTPPPAATGGPRGGGAQGPVFRGPSRRSTCLHCLPAGAANTARANGTQTPPSPAHPPQGTP